MLAIFTLLTVFIVISESNKCEDKGKYSTSTYKRICYMTNFYKSCVCKYIRKSPRKYISKNINQRMQNMRPLRPPKKKKQKKMQIKSQLYTMQPNKMFNFDCRRHIKSFGYVYGGKEAKSNQFPWQVGIEYKNGDEYEYKGGGTIISDRWVLSAAHVFPGAKPDVTKYRGITGVLNITNLNFTHNFDKLIRHPHFDGKTYENDIALLHTTKPMELYPKYEHSGTACLPQENDKFNGKIEVSGWGQTGDEGQYSETLMYVTLPLLNDTECEKEYPNYNKKLMICAGELEGGKDSCFGDSGGPAVMNVNGSFVVVGIVSFGKQEGCALKGVPAVYTRVTNYIDWIRQNIHNVS